LFLFIFIFITVLSGPFFSFIQRLVGALTGI